MSNLSASTEPVDKPKSILQKASALHVTGR